MEGPVHLPGGGHRVPVGPQVLGGEDRLILDAQHHPLGGGAAHVQPDDTGIPCPGSFRLLGLEGHEGLGLGDGGEEAEGGDPFVK